MRVLAASAILPEGYAASSDKAGCAPLRAHTLYEPLEPDQPGTPAHIRTFPDSRDLDALVRAVREAVRECDYVLVSLHWGIHMVTGSIADYQRISAHALIDAGARAVFGHHSHLLKGIEIYRGRPIFYSLGNFAIEQPQLWDPQILQSPGFKHLQSLNPTWSLDQAYTLPPVTRWSGIARLELAAERTRVEFLPAWIDDSSAPVALEPADPRFRGVADFLREACKRGRLRHAHRSSGIAPGNHCGRGHLKRCQQGANIGLLFQPHEPIRIECCLGGADRMLRTTRAVDEFLPQSASDSGLRGSPNA